MPQPKRNKIGKLVLLWQPHMCLFRYWGR